MRFSARGDNRACGGRSGELRTVNVVVVAAMLGGCAASDVKDEGAQEPAPLHLWSDHKILEIPVGACGEKAFTVLTEAGFSGVVRNGNYSYGNLDENRAAVKCVELRKGSFVYFAVASTDKETAEELRNRIARKF